MRSFAFSVTRLVPLLLVLSVFLIAARVARDRMGRSAGRIAFVVILSIAVVIAAGVGLQTSAAVVAKQAYDRQQWQRTDAGYRAYAMMHGRVSRYMAYEWGIALMHGGQWQRAVRTLERTGAPSPRGLLLNSDVTLLIGECLYYAGDLKRAEGAIRVAHRATRPEMRDYFLARIAERQGRTAEAETLFASSIGRNAKFYPAVHHHARLLVAAGDAARAVEELDAYRNRDPGAAGNPTWQAARDAARRSVVPNDVEFYVLES